MGFNHDQITALATDVINKHLESAKESASRYIERTSQVWQDLAFSIASQNFSLAIKKHKLLGILTEGQLKRVQQVLFSPQSHELPSPQFSSDLGSQLQFIRKGRGNTLPVSVTCDLYVEDNVRYKRYAFMIVAPQPNRLMCKAAREDLLKLLAMKPTLVDEAYFVIPSLPIERREPPGASWLQSGFHTNATDVLIGEAFWDVIGGAGSSYAILEALHKSEAYSKTSIYR